MSQETVDSKLIKSNMELLSRLVKRPNLVTEKVLMRPPFRFLFDVVTTILKNSGYLQGLYKEDDLNFNIVNKSKETKILFLDKLINTIGFISSKNLNVKSSKIIAGVEVEKTNRLLNEFAKCVSDKKPFSNAVEKVLKGEKLNFGSNNQSANEKSQSGVKKTSTENNKPVKSLEKQKLQSKESLLIKQTKQLSAETKKKKITKQEIETSNVHIEKKNNNEVVFTVDDVSSEIKLNSEMDFHSSQATIMANSDYEMPSVENINDQDSTVITEQVPDQQLLTDVDVMISNSSIGETTNFERPSTTKISDIAAHAEEQQQKTIEMTNNEHHSAEEKKQEKNDVSLSFIDQLKQQQEIPINFNNNDEKSIIEKTNDKEKDSVINQETRESGQTDNTIVNKEIKNHEKSNIKLSHMLEKSEEFSEKGSYDEKTSSNRLKSLVKKDSVVSSPSNVATQKNSSVSEHPPTAIQKSIRSARPTSSRPAPPRVMTASRSRLMSRLAEASKKTESADEPTIWLPPDNEEDDETNDFVINSRKFQDTLITVDSNTSQKLTDSVTDIDGHLEQTLLNTKSKLEGKIKDNENAQTADSKHPASTDQLRNQIQSLCQSIGNLSKALGYLHEDIDPIMNELRLWKEEYKSNVKTIQKIRLETEKELEPLKKELEDIEKQVENDLLELQSTKSNVFRNKQLIFKLIESV